MKSIKELEEYLEDCDWDMGAYTQGKLDSLREVLDLIEEIDGDDCCNHLEELKQKIELK